MSTKKNQMDRRFYELFERINIRLNRKAEVGNIGSSGQAVVFDASGSLDAGGYLGDMAGRNLYVGNAVPPDSLGYDGDLFALINNSRAGKLPARANFREFASSGSTSVVVADGQGHCVVTTDGIGWDAVEMPSIARWSSVAFGGGKFVAISFNGETAYSTDGYTWAEGAPLPEGHNWSRVAYGNGRFAAVAFGAKAGGGTDCCAATTDGGITWSEGTLPQPLLWTNIAHGPAGFVAITGHLAVIAKSNDGTSWIEHKFPVPAVWTSIAFGGGKYVAVAQNSSYVAYSTDGVAWTLGELPFHGNWNCVTYHDGVWVATAGRADYVAISLDGYEWFEQSTPVNAQWQAVGGLGDMLFYAAHDSEHVVTQFVGDLKSPPSLVGGSAGGPGGDTPPVDVGRPGAFCKAPSSLVESLVMWFTPEPDADGTVIEWNATRGNVLGKIHNPPKGAKSILISNFGSFYDVVMKFDAGALAAFSDSFIYHGNVLNDRCTTNIYFAQIQMLTVGSGIDLTTNTVTFSKVDVNSHMGSDRNWCITITRG